MADDARTGNGHFLRVGANRGGQGRTQGLPRVSAIRFSKESRLKSAAVALLVVTKNRHMKTKLQLFLAVLAAFALPSCFQSETTIRLNKDGSGTLTEETTLGAQALAMIAQFGALGGGQGPDPVAEMASEEKARERAKGLGEGVTLEKVEPIPGKGARLVYRFADINKLKVSTGDVAAGMPKMPGANEAVAGAKADPLTFKYADGVLTITPPKPEADEESVDAPLDLEEQAANPEMEAMMAQMFADTRMSFKVVIEPGIAESDATHVEGNTVTLMEVEMGKLMNDPENRKKLSKVDQNDPASAIEVFKGIDGVKMETKPVITVKVK